ncbi:hypothetical protein MPSEU_000985300 [Mayamaea pseudoterrestris]|nr:hypothetical protein MPSEU_000985300 [Mayamaea pseudoterrestris]
MLVLGQASNSVVPMSSQSNASSGGGASTSGGSNSGSTSATNAAAASNTNRRVSKPQMQRNRSKGTIVAYGSSSVSSEQTSVGSDAIIKDGAANAEATIHSSASNASNHASPQSQQQDQNPCHAARLVLMCTQNALRLGARTQLLLCPPGKSRRELQAALRQKPRLITNANSNMGSPSQQLSASTRQRQLSSQQNVFHNAVDNAFYYGLDKLVGAESLSDYDAQEEAFLLRTNILYSNSANASISSSQDESDEDPSSGDEDELLTLPELCSVEPLDVDALEDRYYPLEPLYLSASTSMTDNANNNYNSRGAPLACSKLPFYRRKLRFFDVGPHEKAIARAYLRNEYRRSKLRATMLLTLMLRRMQLAAKQQRLQLLSDGNGLEQGMMQLSLTSAAVDDKKVATCVEPYPEAMTSSAAAALLLESMVLNPLESVEGMSKCYEGIVAVGVALLDSQSIIDPTSLDTTNHMKHRPLRSEIMAALAPLLITSLEQPSGEVILLLAKLRRMAGTVRYQRRFVQRVAPLLIRPPGAALYCVRHQNDMEAILAAAELIFDSAFDVFSKGWYERGRLLLVDKKRAKTLQSAAQQLRDLVNAEPAEGLALGLPGHRRRSLTVTAASRKVDGQREAMLAEWEVIAVDRQIRASIGSVLTMDWSRTNVHSDIPKPHNRRATSTTKRLSVVPHASTLDSPKVIPSSPRSPPRSLGFGGPSTPPPPLSYLAQQSLTIAPEAVFELSPRESAHRGGRSLSPPSQRLPHSPPPLQRASSHDETKTPMTPPRSPIVTPKSPTKTLATDFTNTNPLSPKLGKAVLAPSFLGLPAPPASTQNSPSASPVGLDAYRTSNAATTTLIQPSNRLLTSSNSERKRTVAACRALRAQIQRFEDAFKDVHGRLPKGASERAPMATTYAQYKEWKRAIRTDAACRVQALFRGAYVRLMLLRGKDPRMTRVVLGRAGRRKASDSIIMSQISLPVEIGQADDQGSSMLSPPAPPRASPVTDPNIPPGQNLPWASKIVRRRSSSDRGDASPTMSATPSGPTSPSELARTSSLTSISSNTPDFEGLELPELQGHKRDLKQQLKQYDMNFARRHGRMPVKAEKEPIRHLYEAYNLLKSKITLMESEGRHSRDVGIVAPLSPLQMSPTPPAPFLPQRLSPTSGSENSGSDDSAAARVMPVPTPRSRRKLPVAGSPPMSTRSQPASAPAGQDLASLKTEKSQLHQMLRSYEKDFFREHNRQVSSYTDIQPVANQYRRYKDIKKAIASLQGQGETA